MPSSSTSAPVTVLAHSRRRRATASHIQAREGTPDGLPAVLTAATLGTLRCRPDGTPEWEPQTPLAMSDVQECIARGWVHANPRTGRFSSAHRGPVQVRDTTRAEAPDANDR